MELEADIIARINSTFASQDSATAIEWLRASGTHGRIARCIVLSARGDLDRLKASIELAAQDFRDVIVAGEYNRALNRIRDLTASFLLDGPETFWIAPLASLLQDRRYVLATLESRPAPPPTGPYLCDHSEGVATFVGDLGPLRITKTQGRWQVTGPSDLRRYNLEGAFTDAQKFADLLSGYILTRRQPTK